MTYPPQQQPDPWGQQQPPQEPWGQQDQWAQQQPPPPQDPWGGGGYDGYGQPPKKGGGKTVAIVLLVLVVLAGAGVGVFFWLKNKDDGGTAGGPGGLNPNDPKSVAVVWADKFAKAYNSDYQEVKAADLKPLMCQSQYKDLDDEQAQADARRSQGASNSALPTSRHRQYKLDIGEVKVNGDAATVMVTATQTSTTDGGSSAAAPKTQTRAFDMKKENGGWKVCGPQGTGGGNPAPSGGGGITPAPGSGGESSVPAPSGSAKPLPSIPTLPTR